MNKNHTMTKYGLLAVLAVVMVLCLSLSLAFTFGNVYAEGETTEPAETVTFHKCSECTAKGDNVVTVVHEDGAIAGYDSLQNAFNEAKDGDIFTLVKCVTGITQTIKIGKSGTDGRNITFDLNGHTVQGYVNAFPTAIFQIGAENLNNPSLTVHFKNGTIINATDTLSGTDNTVFGVRVNGAISGQATKGEFTNMHIEAGKNPISFGAGSNKSIVVNSGEYRSLKYLAFGSGASSTALANIKFTGQGVTESYSYTVTHAERKFFGDYTDASSYGYSNVSAQYQWNDGMFNADNFENGFKHQIDEIALGGDSSSANLKFSVVRGPMNYFQGSKGKYVTLAEAIAANETSVELMLDVPAKVMNEEQQEVDNVQTIPEGATITVDLNQHTFYATIVNNGNLTLCGPVNRTYDSIFGGVIDTENSTGTITAKQYFEITKEATKYVDDNTILIGDDECISVKFNGNYVIREYKIMVENRKYYSYTEAIKAGERNIVMDGEWIKDGKMLEDISIDIGDASLVIDLHGNTLVGLTTSSTNNMALNVISGKVTISNGAIRASTDVGATETARSYAIQNAGELTLENVDVQGGRYSGINGYITRGAIVRNTGKLVMTNCTLNNDLVDSTNDAYGSGIYSESGSVELYNVEMNIYGEYCVYAGADCSVTLDNITGVYAPSSTTTSAIVGTLYAEDGATIKLGTCKLYVVSKFDMAKYAEEDLCVKKTTRSTVMANGSTIVEYSIDEHAYGEPVWTWSNNNTACVATFTCAHGGESVDVDSIVTAESTGSCTDGTITYTATVSFNGVNYTTTTSVLASGHNYGLRVSTAPTKTNYTAFDTFDTTGMIVQKYCVVCGGESTVVGQYEVSYINGNCLHYGDRYAIINADGLSCNVTVNVGKCEHELVWQVSRDMEGAESSWRNINEIESLVYDGGNWYFRAVFEDKLDSENIIVVPVTHGEIKGAKDYVLIADVAEYVDYEFENYDCYVTIERQKINISDRDLFGFNLVLPSGTTDLWDGTVYIYETDEHVEYPSFSLLDLNSEQYKGWKLIDTRSVVASIARDRHYENDNMSIGVTTDEDLNGDNQLFNYRIVGSNVANGVGIYSVTARLVANVNYAFETNYSSAIYSRGLTIDVSLDNKTATVTKVWYVVRLDNWLVVEGTQATPENPDREPDEYVLDGWVYGDNVIRLAPALAYGDIDDASFELLDADRTPIGEVFTKTHFTDYINKSMPAGRYYLQVKIPDLTVNNITYKGATLLLGFRVEGTEIELNLDKNGDTGYLAYEWQLGANREQFFAKFAQELAKTGNVVLTKVTPTGYWANVASNTNYTVTYNLSRMYSNSYYESSDNNILNAIKGGANGTYTVYFQITAPNHNPLVAMNDDRYEYFFTVTVYEVLQTPEVIDAGLVYTGNKVLPEIKESTLSSLYEVVWRNDDEYIVAGQHSVSFKLNDNVHYRWADKTATGDTVTVTYTVAKATNEWIRVPNVVNWTYNAFDTEVNRIRAVVKFLDQGQNIRFTVTYANGQPVEGLNDFIVKEDGTINNSAVIDALKGLEKGTYNLVVTVESTNNYNLLTDSVEFAVGKAINAWLDGEGDLVLPSWIVGKFSLEDNPIVVNALYGQTMIQIRDIEGVVYYDSTNPESNTLNNLEVGPYLLVAWVDETDNYSALERTFTIEVLEKIGLPWWGTTLVTVGALGLAAAIILILWKLKVFEILTDKISLAITTRATIDATIAAVRATKIAEEAEAHKRKVEARERLEAAREVYRNKTPEQRAQDLQAKAEATSTKADEMHAKAGKMRARADKMTGKTEQQPEQVEQPEQSEQPATDVQATDEPSTEE